MKNEADAILRDFPIICQVDNIKREAILPAFLQKWTVECRDDGLGSIRFAIVPLHLSKVLRLPWKSDARSYEVLHLSRKIILATLPSLVNMSLILHLPREMHLCRSPPQMSHPCHRFRRFTLTFCSLFARWGIPWACHAKPHLKLEKWSEHLNMWCFQHFDLETRFALQRGAFLFGHRNFQKCSMAKVLCTFWLRNVLCTAIFDISTSKSAPILRCFVHFDFDMCFAKLFISHLSRVQMAPHPPLWRAWWATNHWQKPSDSPPSYLSAHLHLLSSLIFSLVFFSSLTLPTSAFHLSILSEVWLLHFHVHFHVSPWIPDSGTIWSG